MSLIWKILILFLYGAFKYGPASEPLARHEDALPLPCEIAVQLH